VTLYNVPSLGFRSCYRASRNIRRPPPLCLQWVTKKIYFYKTGCESVRYCWRFGGTSYLMINWMGDPRKSTVVSFQWALLCTLLHLKGPSALLSWSTVPPGPGEVPIPALFHPPSSNTSKTQCSIFSHKLIFIYTSTFNKEAAQNSETSAALLTSTWCKSPRTK
jgi:hypothetical protein